MKFRPVNLQQDYPEIQQLFERSPMTQAPPIEMLPTDGIVCVDKGSIKGALFLFLTSNSRSCILAYPILSKTVINDRNNVIKQMFWRLEYLASALGFNAVNTWTGLDHVADLLEEMEYMPADRQVTQYMKGL